jgi:Tol biopolymer transport system component
MSPTHRSPVRGVASRAATAARSRHARFALAVAIAGVIVACGSEPSTQPEPSPQPEPTELPIAYSFDPDGIGRARDIYLTRADGTGTRKLLDLGSDEIQPEWSPDGRSLLVWQATMEGRLLLVDADGSNVRELLAPFYGVARWSPDGAQFVYTELPYNLAALVVMNLDGTGRRMLVVTGGGASIALPSWSTTGRIAFVISSAYGTSSGVWTVRPDDAATQPAQPFSTGDPDNQWPVWSPDGGRLAYSTCTYDPGADTLFCRLAVINADGTGRRVLATEGIWNIKPTWSPDGKWILYEHWAQSTTAGCSFRRIAPSGGAPITVVPATARSVCGGASWRTAR